MTPDNAAERCLIAADRGAVRWLWLNRPARRNALNAELVTALDEALTDAEHSAAVRAVVLAGRGPGFCAGADLAHLLMLDDAGRHPIQFLREVSDLATRLETTGLPVIAALHGHAVAGGLELALACDAVVAAEDTLIGDGHVRNMLIPAGGSSVRLPRKLGDNLARLLLLTGELLPARDLRDSGWLHDVVPGDQLPATTQSLAERFAASASPAQSAVKKMLASARRADDAAGLRNELDTFRAHWDTAPVAAAVRRFLEGSAAPGMSRLPAHG